MQKKTEFYTWRRQQKMPQMSNIFFRKLRINCPKIRLNRSAKRFQLSRGSPELKFLQTLYIIVPSMPITSLVVKMLLNFAGYAFYHTSNLLIFIIASSSVTLNWSWVSCFRRAPLPTRLGEGHLLPKLSPPHHLRPTVTCQ